jgi:hypothetical protein
MRAVNNMRPGSGKSQGQTVRQLFIDPGFPIGPKNNGSELKQI